MWHLYILQCADRSFYTGITVDLDRRIREHRAGRASKCTRSRLPVRLVYSEAQPDRSRALRREAEIKSWPRKDKLELIRIFRKKKKEANGWAGQAG